MTGLAEKKILIVLRSLNIGGAERQALLLADYLKQKERAQVEVLAFYPGGSFYQEYLNSGIPVTFKNPGTSKNPFHRLILLIRFILTLRNINPDLILPFTDFPNKVCGAVWNLTQAKACVWNQRDSGIEVTGKFLEKRAIAKTSWFVSNSKSGIEFLKNQFKVKSQRISLIHNGIQLPDQAQSTAQWKKELKIDDKTFVVTKLANIQVNKDHLTLVKAWRKFLNLQKNSGKHPVLLLAGKLYPHSQKVINLIKDSGTADSIRLLGEVRDITGLLNISDLAVYSSKTEGSPNGLLECMAAGLPVVATDLPGIREVLGDEYPCYAPGKDPEIFACQLTRIYNDPELQVKLGIENQIRVRQKFSLEQMFQSYSKLLKKLLSGKISVNRTSP